MTCRIRPPDRLFSGEKEKISPWHDKRAAGIVLHRRIVSIIAQPRSHPLLRGSRRHAVRDAEYEPQSLIRRSNVRQHNAQTCGLPVTSGEHLVLPVIVWRPDMVGIIHGQSRRHSLRVLAMARGKSGMRHYYRQLLFQPALAYLIVGMCHPAAVARRFQLSQVGTHGSDTRRVDSGVESVPRTHLHPATHTVSIAESQWPGSLRCIQIFIRCVHIHCFFTLSYPYTLPFQKRYGTKVALKAHIQKVSAKPVQLAETK